MILVYHKIDDDINDENSVPLCEFVQQIKQLDSYDVVHIKDYNAKNVRHAVITFDDGHASILKALPVLKRYKYPFEVYIVGDWFGKSGYIDKKDVKKIIRAGGRLQWHTKTHQDLTKCTNLIEELTVPDTLKELDKNGFESLAFPFWKYDDNVIRHAKKIFTTCRSGNGYAAGHVFALDAIKQKRTTMSDKIVKFIDVSVPTWPCNFRCHYCYVGQQLSDTERTMVRGFKYSPEQFAKLITRKRLGGTCVFNFCAFGETLILPQNVEYCIKILDAGHFLGIVTNMTITKSIDKLLDLPAEYLSRLFFKCSFHYMQLKQRGLLETFVNNVNRAWNAGASITIEITPSDELEEYIDEIKEFSMANFGALPHVTIGRNELMPGYVRLTKHTPARIRKNLVSV